MRIFHALSFAMVLATCTMSCQRDTSSVEVLRARRDRIDRLARSCRPADRAELIVIAAGRFRWPEPVTLASADDRDLRCRAIGNVMHVGRVPETWNVAVLRRHAEPFHDPSVLHALAVLFADDNSWCVDEYDFACSPNMVASVTASTFPIHPLRPMMEVYLPDATILDVDRAYQPSPRAERVDTMVADLTPEAFGQLLDLLAPEHRWNDGLPPPTPDETKEIEQHILDALRWLGELARRRRRPSLDCEVALRASVQEGVVGARILAGLDHPDPEMRGTLLSILYSAPRPSSRERLERIANQDPDAGVRIQGRWALNDLNDYLEASTTPSERPATK